MKNRPINFIFFIICIVAFTFTDCKKKKVEEKSKKDDQPAIVDVIIAQKQSISSNVEANGSIVANEFVELHTEVSGRITYLNIPEGTTVAQGTVLARINDADLQAQLNKTKIQLELAQKTEQRLGKLLAVNGISQGEYDTALNQVNSLKADLAYTQVLIDKTVLKAPFTGLIGLRQISQGAYVSPTTIIATIQQVNKLKVDFTVPEEYSNAIRKGAVVEVAVEGLSKSRCKAVVIAREPQVNQTTRNLLIRATLSNCNANPGTFAKVYFNAGGARSNIIVPTNAIIPDDKNKKVVLVKDGKASYTVIETGIRKEGDVEVTSGLSVGDSIITDGVLFARPDKPVKVRNVKSL
ncbi:MAG: efflux RND transporter periplasmic adaptor subunit [Arcicella sp.]|jgi:membrane fusion protein (multidrug efflux system)|nr:efflux RND transporter periplasmic adaptor subunit [Arcicella sp.]